MTPAGEESPAPSAAGASTAPHPPVDAAAGDFVSVEHLVKEFPLRDGGLLQRRARSVKAVSDVSFTVARGETFGLVGESGCGKTTLARMLVALETPTSGTVRIDGVDPTSLTARALREQRRRMQLVFQDPFSSLDPRMRVAEIVREPLRVQRLGARDEQEARVRELLVEVGLGADAADRFPHEFSGGQRQRVSLARALALHPSLVVADEPVSALDVSIRSQILNLMNSLQRTYGLTYVVISHDLSVVRYMARRTAVMYLGKLVEVGPSELLYSRPAHPYTAGLIDAIPAPDPAFEKAKRADPPSGETPSAIDPPSGCRYRTRCPRAEAVCADEEPALRAFTRDHVAACHFPLRPPGSEAGPRSPNR